jgi:hypothetical protein
MVWGALLPRVFLDEIWRPRGVLGRGGALRPWGSLGWVGVCVGGWMWVWVGGWVGGWDVGGWGVGVWVGGCGWVGVGGWVWVGVGWGAWGAWGDVRSMGSVGDGLGALRSLGNGASRSARQGGPWVVWATPRPRGRPRRGVFREGLGRPASQGVFGGGVWGTLRPKGILGEGPGALRAPRGILGRCQGRSAPQGRSLVRVWGALRPRGVFGGGLGALCAARAPAEALCDHTCMLHARVVISAPTLTPHAFANVC